MAKGIIKGLGRRYQMVDGEKVFLEKVPNKSGRGYTWQKPKKKQSRNGYMGHGNVEIQ